MKLLSLRNLPRGLIVAMAGALAASLGRAQVPDTFKQTFLSPSTAAQATTWQGYSVAVDGNTTVVGAPSDDTGGADSGVVRVYHTTTGQLLHTLNNPTPQAGDQFGASVAISGTRVVVGAMYDDAGATNAGSAYVYDLAAATPTAPIATLNNPNPEDNDHFGCSVSISGTRIVVGAEWDGPSSILDGSAYVYNLVGTTPTVPVVTLNNPNTVQSSDTFGRAVAISGTRVVVGAPLYDSGWESTGRAYVFDVASGTPTTPVVTLAKSNPFASDLFGASVAISGSRVVVGATGHDTAAQDAGGAFVYDVASATPTVPVVTLTNPSPSSGDAHGCAVSISGTYVVVGAYNRGFVGRAYVYNLANSTPSTVVASLGNPTPISSDNFGWAASISGTKIVIGAYQDDTIAVDSGSAYTFDVGTVTPTALVATLTSPSQASSESFGSSISVSGTRMVVGARLEDTGANDAGCAYVYDLGSGSPTTVVATLNNPTPAATDYFGFSISISGALVAVGAYFDDTTAPNAGIVYIFNLDSATPAVPAVTLNNPSPTTDDFFGYAVAISGTRVIVGTYLDDTGASAAGSAYVYDLASATPTVPIVVLNNPSPAANDQFGRAVAISAQRVVVGVRGDDTGATDAGITYVYDLASATPTVPILTLENPRPGVSDSFSWAVGISGTRVVVGAYWAENAGSAYAYDLNGATPQIPVATLNNPEPAPSDEFGKAVAISGTRVVVGARLDDAGATDTGRAYVFDLAGTTPTVPVATIGNPGSKEGDQFGASVAIDGTTVAIGADLHDNTTSDQGAAYIFRPADNDIDDDGLLDIWEYARFGNTVGHTAMDDADGDGRTELLELAFNTDPTRSDAAAPATPMLEDGFLTITIARRAGVAYTAESSATPNAPDFSAATTTILTNNATTLKVRDNYPVGANSQRFLRVQVTASP